MGICCQEVKRQGYSAPGQGFSYARVLGEREVVSVPVDDGCKHADDESIKTHVKRTPEHGKKFGVGGNFWMQRGGPESDHERTKEQADEYSILQRRFSDFKSAQ